MKTKHFVTAPQNRAELYSTRQENPCSCGAPAESQHTAGPGRLGETQGGNKPSRLLPDTPSQHTVTKITVSWERRNSVEAFPAYAGPLH